VCQSINKASRELCLADVKIDKVLVTYLLNHICNDFESQSELAASGQLAGATAKCALVPHEPHAGMGPHLVNKSSLTSSFSSFSLNKRST
jgi:hypothetical protein